RHPPIDVSTSDSNFQESKLERKRELGDQGPWRREEVVNTASNRNRAVERNGPIVVWTASLVWRARRNRRCAAYRRNSEISVLDVTGRKADTTSSSTSCRVLSLNNVGWIPFVVAQLPLGGSKGHRDNDIEIPESGDLSS